MTEFNIIELWNNGSKDEWTKALGNYWEMPSVQRNLELEHEMNELHHSENLDKIRKMNGKEFHEFLYNKYFVWKYTAHNRLETTRKQLGKQSYDELQGIKDSLFVLYENIPEDLELLLVDVQRIKGLGVAGGSGLLSLLFPELFGTVDQFLVDSLCEISGSMTEEKRDYLCNIKKESIKLEEGVFLEKILQEKACELNERFGNKEWTPRKIDMILWSYR